MAYKILYYSWNENTCKDCVDSMRSLGHNVDVITYAIKNYNIDDGFTDFLTEYLTKGYDLIFTFNYFPLISNIAHILIYFSFVDIFCKYNSTISG